MNTTICPISVDPNLARDTATQLETNGARLEQTPSLLGFDGFIDTIYHVVDVRQSASEYTRVRTLADYGGRIAAAAGKSTNVEIVPQNVKLGGNGPIMANALCALGVPVTYCGMTGYPTLNEVFRELSERARLLPLADPALTDAIEFDDGKLIVGKHATVAEVSSATIHERVGDVAWRVAWESARFVAMVNWTMLPYLTDMWKQMLDDFAFLGGGAPNSNGATSASDATDAQARKTLFFDLADPEKRTHEDLVEALQTIARFEAHHDVLLGLNEKEAQHAASALGLNTQAGDSHEQTIMNLAEAIRAHLNIHTVVVHPTHFAAAANREGAAVAAGPYTPNPKISTGAGDHFNAGFCAGQMMGCNLAQSLQVGVVTSGYYVRNAITPNRQQLVEFLRSF